MLQRMGVGKCPLLFELSHLSDEIVHTAGGGSVGAADVTAARPERERERERVRVRVLVLVRARVQRRRMVVVVKVKKRRREEENGSGRGDKGLSVRSCAKRASTSAAYYYSDAR